MRSIKRAMPEKNARIQIAICTQEIEKPCLAAAIMFAYKFCHGTVKHAYIIHTRFSGTFSFEMNDTAIGKIIIFITSLSVCDSSGQYLRHT